MIISHQVTTPAPLQPDDLEYGFTTEEAAEILSRFEKVYFEEEDYYNEARPIYKEAYLVLVDSKTKPYVSKYDRDAVLQMWREELDAGRDPSAFIYSIDAEREAAERKAEQARIDAFDAKREWIENNADSDAFVGENRSQVYAAWERKYEERLTSPASPKCDPTMGGLFAFYENEAEHLKALAEYETNVAGLERRAQESKELAALTQDPAWIDATKHLDAVAAFVAAGTHNPRAYARAQGRFVGAILKLSQRHEEDIISKAVEDRFALLAHDGIQDVKMLDNRLDLIRAAVNEVFQNPNMDDVVGRDMVGL